MMQDRCEGRKMIEGRGGKMVLLEIKVEAIKRRMDECTRVTMA